MGPPVRQSTAGRETETEGNRQRDLRGIESIWLRLKEEMCYSKLIGSFQGGLRRLSESTGYSWVFQLQFPLFPKTCLPMKSCHVQGKQYSQVGDGQDKLSSSSLGGQNSLHY